MTGTTPLDLDAIKARYEAANSTESFAEGAVLAAVSADDVPALVEEVERLRGLLHDAERMDVQLCEARAERDSAVTERGVVLTEVKQIRVERDAAIARAEKADDERRSIDLNLGHSMLALDRVCTERDEALAKARATSDEVHRLTSMYGGETKDRIDTANARADALEKAAREANAECIKHWNRADAVEAKVAAGLAILEGYRLDFNTEDEDPASAGDALWQELRAALGEVEAGCTCGAVECGAMAQHLVPCPHATDSEVQG